MTETPNHEYNVPESGEQNWHEPLNDNFEALEIDVEIRAAGAPDPADFEPQDGAKYLDTETGDIYLGDGSDWTLLGQIGDELGGRYLDEVGFSAPAEWENDGDTDVNEASDTGAVVAGGHGNTASNQFTTISGGENNEANVWYSTIGGGQNNLVAGAQATVSGGRENLADDTDATVGGGHGNEAIGALSTIGGGRENEALESAITIAGGDRNVASEWTATICGGMLNEATGQESFIGGGRENTVESLRATIGGGGENTAGDEEEGDDVEYPTVGGGYLNEATGDRATIAGGENNEASREYATVAGGLENNAEGDYSFIGGGEQNQTRTDTAIGSHEAVCGGYDNTAAGGWTFIGSGQENETSGNRSAVVSGQENEAAGEDSFIGSGDGNATGEDADGAVIPGGSGCVADGEFSFAVGRNGSAEHDGSYVFADSSISSIASDDPDTAYFQMDVVADDFVNNSSAAMKENIEPFSPETALEGVTELPVSKWEFQHREGEHIGPMAEDFHDQFGVGDDTTISNLDANGVAFAAIQGLAQELEQAQAELEEKDQRITEQAKRIDALEDRIDALEN